MQKEKEGVVTLFSGEMESILACYQLKNFPFLPFFLSQQVLGEVSSWCLEGRGGLVSAAPGFYGGFSNAEFKVWCVGRTQSCELKVV